MNVSRETSLSNLLVQIVKTLKINTDIFASSLAISGLTRSATGLILHSINSISQKPLLVIVENSALVERLYLSSYNLMPDKTAYYPESLKSGLDIPGFNLENERYRSEVFNIFSQMQVGLIFTTGTAVNEPAIDVEPEKEITFFLKDGDALNRQILLNKLGNWGYEQVDHTETPKTFSTRGGIIDVFLPYGSNPIRIELFGNIIDSIRTYNPRSQRTIKNIDHIEILPPPSKNVFPTDKISLLEFIGDDCDTVWISENVGSLRIQFSEAVETEINLNCKKIQLSENEHSGDDDYIGSLLNLLKEKEFYLFTDKKDPSATLKKHSLDSILIINNILESGFFSDRLGLCCLSLPELNNQQPVFQSRWTVDTVAEIPQKEFSSLEDLDWGDYLVHQDFGIGLYRGLETIVTHDNINQECIKIEYADSSNVYVPIDKFNRVHRMIITGDKEPVLSSLNSPKWNRQKQIAKDSAKTVVHDLVNLYSSRNRKRGFKYNNNNGFMYELENSFPYEETPGQKDAIVSVMSDMEREFPVDRLICGDVGFGKTEVALRAALKAIISGKKVLFLTPTTILADQHYISTRGRFEPLGVNVELLSRFKTKKEQQEILEKMMLGKTDLVIGTHRLLSKDVQFPDLGLLIIDEEHRFGVKHKEKLRHLRSTVDVLTLTATPIPRTLQQSLLGIRDISRINTPPKTRRPIKTFVQYFNWNSIKTVVDNELARGGQVYFLHNDISSIPFILKKLIELFPNYTTGVAHGRMSSKELENTVLSFFAGEIYILLCTTIIESGLDVSNANTIIINNAQNFGLSQLYQIRGRVGRSHRQAYCYLLLPHGKTIGDSAKKRLKAIEQYTTLGSGYDISLKDLEIRGGGNLFGYKQSGNMAAVGFEMYCKLLQEAVDESLGKNDSQVQPPKISIPINAMLENSYVSLVQDRLYFYQQLSEATDLDTVNNVESELVDRFGRLPDTAKNLLYITRLSIRLTNTAVTYVSVVGSDLRLKLSDFLPFTSVNELISAIEDKMKRSNLSYQFTPSKEGFSVSVKTSSINNALAAIELFVELFSK